MSAALPFCKKPLPVPQCLGPAASTRAAGASSPRSRTSGLAREESTQQAGTETRRRRREEGETKRDTQRRQQPAAASSTAQHGRVGSVGSAAVGARPGPGRRNGSKGSLLGSRAEEAGPAAGAARFLVEEGAGLALAGGVATRPKARKHLGSKDHRRHFGIRGSRLIPAPRLRLKAEQKKRPALLSSQGRFWTRSWEGALLRCRHGRHGRHGRHWSGARSHVARGRNLSEVQARVGVKKTWMHRFTSLQLRCRIPCSAVGSWGLRLERSRLAAQASALS